MWDTVGFFVQLQLQHQHIYKYSLKFGNRPYSSQRLRQECRDYCVCESVRGPSEEKRLDVGALVG